MMKERLINIRKKIPNWVFNGIIFIVLFTAFSSFLARNMLSRDQVMPPLVISESLKLLDEPLTQNSWEDSPQHLVYFFAPWCQVCALSQPSLEAFAKLKPNIPIVMVALDWQSPSEVSAFKTDHGYEQLILLGNSDFKNQWQVDAYPSYYFVDNKGQITSKDRGLVTLPGLLARSI